MKKKLIYTAMSKRNFYLRDMISRFVLERGMVPLNPFKNWDYFLGDMVSRDLIREANWNLVAAADEVWQFGEISNGCFYELKQAKVRRYFKLGKMTTDIVEVEFLEMGFEKELIDEIGEKMIRKELMK